MIRPLSTIKVAVLVNNIRVRNQSLIDILYPDKLILNDINNSVSELRAQGAFDADDYVHTIAVEDTENVVDLSTYEDYKLLTNIMHIKFERVERDRSYTDLCINLEEWDFEKQIAYGSGSVYKDDVTWYRKGDIVYFSKGTNVANYNQRTIYLNRLPKPAVEMFDFVDVKDDKISMVESLAEMKLLRRQSGAIDLQQVPRKIEQMIQTEQRDEQKSREK